LTVLLDTSVLVDILRASPPALAYARELDQTPLCSELTRVEILRGLRSGERSKANRILQALRWIDLDETIARRAGELGRTFRRSHPGIGTVNLVIAATAQELGLELATGNVKHFPMFPGLRPPYPG
jgi:predicted nucleic acid-binding protein